MMADSFQATTTEARLQAQLLQATNQVAFALSLLKFRAEELPYAQAERLRATLHAIEGMQPFVREQLGSQHLGRGDHRLPVLQQALQFQQDALSQMQQLAGLLGWDRDASALEFASQENTHYSAGPAPAAAIPPEPQQPAAAGNTVSQSEMGAVVAALAALTTQLAMSMRSIEATRAQQPLPLPPPMPVALPPPWMPQYGYYHGGAPHMGHAYRPQHYIEPPRPYQVAPTPVYQAIASQLAMLPSPPPPRQPNVIYRSAEVADVEEDTPKAARKPARRSERSSRPVSMRVAGSGALMIGIAAVIGLISLADRIFVESSSANPTDQKNMARLSDGANESSKAALLEERAGPPASPSNEPMTKTPPPPVETYTSPLKVAPLPALTRQQAMPAFDPARAAEKRPTMLPPSPAARPTSRQLAELGLTASIPPPRKTPSIAAAPPPSSATKPVKVEQEPAKAKPAVTKVAVAKTAPVTAPAQSPAGGKFVAVLSTHKDQQAATQAFADLRKQYPGVLGDKQSEIQSSSLGEQGTWHRLVLLPASSREEAAEVCSKLRTSGYSRCWVKAY